MKLTGAQILVEELIRQGVEVIFGYPGGAVLNIYDELYKNSDRIYHVITAHEQGAAHAADGYARASGKTGVVLATSGPGATNLVTGIANACLDSVPMVAITGNVAVNALGRDSFQEVDIVGITQPIVKHNFMVRDVEDLELTIKEAFKIANSGRKGPVLIDIPKSVQLATAEYGHVKLPEEPDRPKSIYNLDKVLELIRGSKKPFIYCGGGVIAAGAEAEVLELSRRMDSPIGLSMMGRSAIPDSYERNLGMCGMHGNYASSKAQSECDLMIAVGVRFSDRATGDIKEYTRKCTVVHIDIDRAEIGKNVMPDISINGDLKEVVLQLLEQLEQQSHQPWIEEVIEYKKEDNPPKDRRFSPRNILQAVRQQMTDDTVVSTDVGQHQMWTIQYYRFEKSHKLLTSGGLGTMGYGLGAAIGGCFANGKKRTLMVTSDGSFGMNLNELCTVVSQELPITVLILNNHVLGMVRQWQEIFYDERYSQTTLSRKSRFADIANAFGAKGFSVESLEELEQVLEQTNTGDKGAYVIDCHIDMNEKVYPMIPPGRSFKDIILKG